MAGVLDWVNWNLRAARVRNLPYGASAPADAAPRGPRAHRWPAGGLPLTYCRGVRTTSLIHARVFASTGPATLVDLAARSALIFCRTIRPSPANTATATTDNTTDFGFSAMRTSY